MELADEYVPEPPRRVLGEAERRLMLAVLHEALRELNVHHLRDGAMRWITDLKSDHVFGMKSICSTLGFNAHGIIQLVRAGKRIPSTMLKHNGANHAIRGKMLVGIGRYER